MRALGLDGALGRFLGGDKGEEVAERIARVATSVTGASSAEDVLSAISADEGAASALRLRLLELADKEADREAADRSNARALQQTALQQEDLMSKRFVYYFAWTWSLFAMLYIALITFIQLPDSSQRYADTVLGFLLGTVIATILTFFYGSSRGSQTKDLSITALVEQMNKN